MDFKINNYKNNSYPNVFITDLIEVKNTDTVLLSEKSPYTQIPLQTIKGKVFVLADQPF